MQESAELKQAHSNLKEQLRIKEEVRGGRGEGGGERSKVREGMLGEREWDGRVGRRG